MSGVLVLFTKCVRGWGGGCSSYCMKHVKDHGHSAKGAGDRLQLADKRSRTLRNYVVASNEVTL